MTPTTEGPRLRVETAADGVRARITGCALLDEVTTPEVQEQLFRVVDEMKAGELHLDLSGVRFLSSTALGMLIDVNKKMKDREGHLTIHGVEAGIQEMFDVTNLTRLLNVRPQ